jgi:hypothetical protein
MLRQSQCFDHVPLPIVNFCKVLRDLALSYRITQFLSNGQRLFLVVLCLS